MFRKAIFFLVWLPLLMGCGRSVTHVSEMSPEDFITYKHLGSELTGIPSAVAEMAPDVEARYYDLRRSMWGGDFIFFFELALWFDILRTYPPELSREWRVTYSVDGQSERDGASGKWTENYFEVNSYGFEPGKKYKLTVWLRIGWSEENSEFPVARFNLDLTKVK